MSFTVFGLKLITLTFTRSLMLQTTRDRLAQLTRLDAVASPVRSGQCGKGWTGTKGQCRRAQLRRIAKVKKVGKQAGHIAEHLGENVAAWGVGKVIGGAIAQVGVKHGLDPGLSKQLAETAVQALTATLIHARKKENRNAKELGTYFMAQSAAAFLGKEAHGAIDESILGADAQVRAIAAMAAGKGTGIGVATGAKQTLDRIVKRVSFRRDSATRNSFRLDADSPLSPDEHEALFTLTLLGILQQRSDRTDGRKVLQKTGGKRPGIRCGRGWISAAKKCKSHRNNGKLTEEGKAAAQELAVKVKRQKEKIRGKEKTLELKAKVQAQIRRKIRAPTAVLIQEDSIRTQRFESAAVFDKKGDRLLFRNGNKNSVDFSLEEVKRLKGLIVTHNHPDGWNHPAQNPQSKGSSFSIDDWKLAAWGQVAEMRAVSRGYRHSIKPPKEGWNQEYWEKTLQPALEKARQEVREKWTKRIAGLESKGIEAQQKEVDKANAANWHEIATLVSKRLGITYTRESYKEWKS